ncbi:MAG: NAD(P)/FAD-dependent oxidoreductase [Bacteroidetes bacterium]|nr:NAD(P)/FAD-dependent oxidoreductase [Bacteroidota bacterium]NOG57901.1 NAD(P)/FAD-dependent oxidoreductase [Bacteroidota bacterium]
MRKEILIIGGGASGFFAAINIAESHPDYQVIILEKSNQLLAKVRISGGGRCNVTHACFEPKDLSKFYPRGEKEMLGAFHRFSTGDVIEWFAKRNVELKIEEDGRMFPVSDRSETIIDCFMQAVKDLGIEVRLKSNVKEIQKETRFTVILDDDSKLNADHVVVAVGGNPKLSHYSLISQLGHQIEKPIPSLFTFNLPQSKSNELMGLALDAEVQILGTKYSEYGPVLFTHWGMSGPAILKLSARAAIELYQKSYQFKFQISWLENTEDFLADVRKNQAAKKLINTKPAEFPNRFWQYLLDRAEVYSGKNWGDLSKNELDRIESCLTKDIYEANGKTTFKEEFVTAGGIDLKEINMKTMESKLVDGLFFCGEVMNVDALTGGFNFQAAWTSAWHVAQNV